MKSLLFLGALMLAPSFGHALSCPYNPVIFFGEIEDKNSNTMVDLEKKRVSFEIVKGKRVCHYISRVPGLKLKLYNYKKPRLLIYKDPAGDEAGYNLEVNVLRKALIRGRQIVRDAEFSLTQMYFDEDGCAFGQVPCEEMPEEVGYTLFDKITLKLHD